MKEFNFIVSDEDEGVRVDKYLSDVLPDLSRSYIQKQISDGLLKVNDKPSKAGYKLKADDDIFLQVPDSVVPDIEPEDIPIDIVYEDKLDLHLFGKILRTGRSKINAEYVLHIQFINIKTSVQNTIYAFVYNYL